MASQRTRAQRRRASDRRYVTRQKRNEERVRARHEGYRDGERTGRHEAREELTKHLRSPGRREGMPEDPFKLNEQPEQPFVILHMMPNHMMRHDELMNQSRPPHLMRTPVARFEAKKSCWESGSGQRIVWWEWEFKGVSG